MSVFRKLLAERQTDPKNRRWLYIPYDQVTDKLGPLSRFAPTDVGIIVIENPWKAAHRPYHRQKLALILANLRHFALEQAERGVAIRHVIANGPYRTALKDLTHELGPITMMEPAERELRIDLGPLIKSKLIEAVPHEGWLTTRADFLASAPSGPPWRMDAFYRLVRRQTGILMEQGKPIGGKFSFDAENRKAWRGDPPAPNVPLFPTNPIKEEVADLIESKLSRHPGRLDLESLPATAADTETLWKWFLTQGLDYFGPFEDAMSLNSASLFHSRVSALLNIHRLTPARVVRDVARSPSPLPCREGFIRQVLGWREFVYHVHRETDGFRNIHEQTIPIAREPGDGGYKRWTGNTWCESRTTNDPDGGAAPSYLGAKRHLPSAYWGVESGLTCLDRVVRDVWNDAYSHHITRLMILSNIAALLDVEPRELTDWFWAAYADAYDWVVEPNVLAMGTFGVGDLMTTKPYVSGAPYIHKMSDYCAKCSFDPKKNCPISRLYWAYLARHEKKLAKNPRMNIPILSMRKRSEDQRSEDAKVFHEVTSILSKGDLLTPNGLYDETSML